MSSIEAGTLVVEATFKRRPNRFLGIVRISNSEVPVFIPNPGRMYELLTPGKRVYLRPARNQKRKTKFDLIAVKHNDILVSIDSLLPNRFVYRLLKEHRLPMFKGYNRIIKEPRVFNGRFDFMLVGDIKKSLLEVKSCTLVENGRALFPDAPTVRGARHLDHLVKSLREKKADDAAVLFVVQRPDAHVFSPNTKTDPAFSRALKQAYDQGVKIVVLLTELVDWDLKLLDEIPYQFA